MSDNLRDTFIKRLKEDDKYKKIIEATPEDAREEVQSVVEEFMKSMADAMVTIKEQVSDPETRKKLQEALKDRK